MNLLGPTQFTLEHEKANQWRLASRNEGRQGSYKLTQKSDNELYLEHSYFDEPLLLRRTTPSDASKYFSRSEQ